MASSSSPDAVAWEWGGLFGPCAEKGPQEAQAQSLCPGRGMDPRPPGKGSSVTLDQPLPLSPGSWWHPHAGPSGAAARLPIGLVSRPFQGKILFLVQLPPPGPLQLLTILLSICKSFNVENCHPESDSGGWWSLCRQGLGCPNPLSSKAALHPAAATSQGSPGSQKLAVLTYLAEPSGSWPWGAKGTLPARQVLCFFLSPEFPWWQPQPPPSSTPVISLLPCSL